MYSTVSIGKAIDDGLANLKLNFWSFILIVIILGVIDSLSNGPAIREGLIADTGFISGDFTNGYYIFFIGVFIKPAFDFAARLQFVKGNRGEEVELMEITNGFDTKDLYINIVLTNLMIFFMVVLGLICLVLPGIYIACRIVLTSYLVMDKGLAPRQAVSASWELMRDFWPKVILLGLVAMVLFVGGLILLIVGVLPAIAWIKGIFASFYQQIIDVHDEEFLLSLGIEP